MRKIAGAAKRKLELLDDSLFWSPGHRGKGNSDVFLSTPVLGSHQTIASRVQSRHVAHLGGDPLHHALKVDDVVHLVVVRILCSSLRPWSKDGDVNFAEFLLELVASLPWSSHLLLRLVQQPGGERCWKVFNCIQYILNRVVRIRFKIIFGIFIWYRFAAGIDKRKGKENWRVEGKHVDCWGSVAAMAIPAEVVPALISSLEV